MKYEAIYYVNATKGTSVHVLSYVCTNAFFQLRSSCLWIAELLRCKSEASIFDMRALRHKIGGGDDTTGTHNCVFRGFYLFFHPTLYFVGGDKTVKNLKAEKGEWKGGVPTIRTQSVYF